MASSSWLGKIKDSYREGYRKELESGLDPEEKELAKKVAETERNDQILQAWLSPQDEDGVPDTDGLYEPLPESSIPLIRIIQLLPGSGWEPIHVVFDVAAADSVDYEALSYTWGNSSEKSPITCNGRRIDVTKNLKTALRDLRLPDSPRRLWVDAICINQNDLSERERQVGCMRDIFSGSSSRTVLWLGPEFLGVDVAFSMLKRLNDIHGEGVEDGSFDFHTILYKDEKISEELIGTGPTEVELRMFYKLIDRPYFGRCWIIQEIALPNKVYVTCGSQGLDWDEFLRGALVCFFFGWHDGASRTSIFQPLLRLYSTRLSAVNGADIEDLDFVALLNEHRQSEATDPRDKVYALFGLTVSDVKNWQLSPNYRLDVKQLYIDVAKAIILHCDTLELFSIPRGKTAIVGDLPSWAQDWSDTSKLPNSYITRSSGNDDFPTIPFNASGYSTLPIPVFLPQNRLQLRGHRVDAVSSLAETLPATDFDSSLLYSKASLFDNKCNGFRSTFKTVGQLYGWLYTTLANDSQQADVFAQWDNMVLGEGAASAQTMYGPTNETREMAYVRTLSCDFMPRGADFALESFRLWKNSRKEAQLLRKAKLHRVPPLHKFLGAASTVLSSRSPNNPFLGVIEDVVRRRICWTERGYLGVMPPEANVGDELWIIQGCRMPLVLRASGDSGYELVGDCYIHGAMYGERFKPQDCRDVVLV